MSGSVLNLVKQGFYLDSVALMRISRELTALPGVEEAAVMMGTPANRAIMADAGILSGEGRAAEGGDLVIALRAADAAAAKAALEEAERLLSAPKGGGGGAAAAWKPRSLRAAVKALPDANLALISVPGDFAAAEARKALRRGLHAMIFSDNVPLAQERALKEEAREAGLLVMGPDCGTAVINGVPLAFANILPRGDIGLIGASGTGLQEVSCLIARRPGYGVSQAIGVGGRDLKAEIGGITTLMAFEALDSDPATQSIVLISKPPAAEVAERLMKRIAASAKPCIVCFIGAPTLELPANARQATTLEAAAELACNGAPLPPVASAAIESLDETLSGSRRLVRGLFSGGTLCAEAQVVFLEAGEAVSSNAPVPGAEKLNGGGHRLLDLGDDEFTRGRPHPMIDPGVRDQALREALSDPAVGVVLLDLVIGQGAHADPAGHLAEALRGAGPRPACLVASVTGTEADPQGLSAQAARLSASGVRVANSNAEAARIALRLVRDGR